METYKCSKCGMTVNATCGKCNEPLVNDTIKLDNGKEVQIFKKKIKRLLRMRACILRRSLPRSITTLCKFYSDTKTFLIF